MSRATSMIAAAALAAAAYLAITAFTGEPRVASEEAASCAAALCGMVIF